MPSDTLTGAPALDGRRKLALLRLSGQSALNEYRHALRRNNISEAHFWSVEVDRVCDQLDALQYELFGVERREVPADEFFVYDDESGIETLRQVGWIVVAIVVTVALALLGALVYRAMR